MACFKHILALTDAELFAAIHLGAPYAEVLEALQ